MECRCHPELRCQCDNARCTAQCQCPECRLAANDFDADELGIDPEEEFDA